MAGEDDLDDVTNLELVVDTSEQTIERLGEMCPNLTSLKLNNSTLESFRDLGTSLRTLRILWLSRSGVTDLDGIGALVGLQELYLAFNDITDLTPLAMHDCLQVLDIESNRVSDMNQIDQLGTCPNLFSLSLALEGNPVHHFKGYRRLVVHYIPQLQCLDEKDVDTDDYIEVTHDLLEQVAITRPPSAKEEGNEQEMVVDAIKYARVDAISGRATDQFGGGATSSVLGAVLSSIRSYLPRTERPPRPSTRMNHSLLLLGDIRCPFDTVEPRAQTFFTTSPR
jgi:hypothetical protein